MIRLGICLNMFSDSSDPIGIKHLSALKNSGYDYVELPLAQIMDLNEEQFQTLLYELRNCNVPCEVCNNFFPASVRLTGENVSKERIRKYLDSAFARLRELGGKVVVFGSSGAKNVPAGYPMDLAFNQITEVLRIVSEYAKKDDIVIAIEPLNHMESNIILNLEDGMRLVQAVNRDNIKLLVDYYHFARENEQLSALRAALKNIVHVHFAEPPNRVYPTTVQKEYKEFIQVLIQNNYHGRLSVEAFSKEPSQDLIKAYQVLTSMMPYPSLT